MDLALKIDHTCLKPNCTEDDITRLCNEAIQYGFYSVCVPPAYVAFSHNLLRSTKVKVCTVVGFPLGYQTLQSKLFETREAITSGADEIDMVINISFVKSGKPELIKREISEIAAVCHFLNIILKVIIETALLNKDEIKEISLICAEAGADFVKTSTGFASTGALVEDVALIRSVLGGSSKIKASGGIKTRKDALRMIEAGADRLGTSSGVMIVDEAS